MTGKAGKWRKRLSNAGLSLASVFITYLVVELFLFKALMPLLPPSAYSLLIKEARVLGQSSKNDLVPEPGYVAIFGDSYAQGKGDWFIDNNYNRASRYHSAHVIQDLLGTDVVTYGKSGAGSVDGIVLEPLQIRRYLANIGHEVPVPGTILMYFYEGNDIRDNVRLINDHLMPAVGGDVTVLDDPVKFNDFLDDLVEEYATGKGQQSGDWALFGNFLFRLVRDKVIFQIFYADGDDKLAEPGSVNKVNSGKVVAVPDQLQDPSLYLSDQVIINSLKVFENSAIYARNLYPEARMVVVYIPSPLSCYELVSDQVSTQFADDLFPAASVGPRSDLMAGTLEKFAKENGMTFVDSRPMLRAEAAKGVIHGPRDWDHFNRVGYETLGRAIAEALEPEAKAQ